MNKKEFIVPICAVVFIIAILGLILYDKQKNGDSEYFTSASDSMKNGFGSRNKGDISNSDLAEMKVSESNKKVSGKEPAVDNPQSSATSIGKMKVDAALSLEEWQRRIDSGVNADGITAANASNKELYYYKAIDPSLKQLYCEVYLSITGFCSDICLCSISPDDIDLIFNCVLADHPEIYYVDGYMYTRYISDNEVVRISFTPTYTKKEEEVETYNDYIEEYFNAFQKGISSNASEYEKIRYTYEFVIANTEYKLEAKENQNILSVFLNKESVCQGYAKAFQYLLGRLNVEATLVVGMVGEDEYHAWNMVKCKGSYYFVDCTWGDSSYFAETGYSDQIYAINYDYLNITTEELAKTHEIMNFVDIPVCKCTDYNYYIAEGLYFDSVDADQLKKAFDEAYLNNRQTIEIKCKNAIVYDEMGKYLLDENHIFDYLSKEVESVSLVRNNDMYIYCFALI